MCDKEEIINLPTYILTMNTSKHFRRSHAFSSLMAFKYLKVSLKDEMQEFLDLLQQTDSCIYFKSCEGSRERKVKEKK